MNDLRMLDGNEKELKVGSLVLAGVPGEPGVVETITEWDGDVDDEGRSYGIAPVVLVRWPGEPKLDRYGTIQVSLTDPYGPDYAEVRQCEDLEVVADTPPPLSDIAQKLAHHLDASTVIEDSVCEGEAVSFLIGGVWYCAVVELDEERNP